MAHRQLDFDSNIIRQFASRLYRRADSIIVSYVLFGLVFGATMGLLGVSKLGVGQFNPLVVLFLSAGMGVLVGYAIGAEKAFKLRLEAQIALCQVQIEKNTKSLATTNVEGRDD